MDTLIFPGSPERARARPTSGPPADGCTPPYPPPLPDGSQAARSRPAARRASIQAEPGRASQPGKAEQDPRSRAAALLWMAARVVDTEPGPVVRSGPVMPRSTPRRWGVRLRALSTNHARAQSHVTALAIRACAWEDAVTRFRGRKLLVWPGGQLCGSVPGLWEARRGGSIRSLPACRAGVCPRGPPRCTREGRGGERRPVTLPQHAAEEARLGRSGAPLSRYHFIADWAELPVAGRRGNVLGSVVELGISIGAIAANLAVCRVAVLLRSRLIPANPSWLVACCGLFMSVVNTSEMARQDRKSVV